MLTAINRFRTLASKKSDDGGSSSVSLNAGDGGSGGISLKSDPMEDVVVTRLMTRSPGGGAG